jgi:hypothetical protein
MDPVTVIVSALSLGAAAGLEPTVATAVKDGYAGLKALVLRKFGTKGDAADALAKVETKPDSAGRKTTLQEELTAAGADRDQEVVDRAAELLKLLESEAPGVTGGLVGQINAAGGKVLVLSGGNQGIINIS